MGTSFFASLSREPVSLVSMLQLAAAMAGVDVRSAGSALARRT